MDEAKALRKIRKILKTPLEDDDAGHHCSDTERLQAVNLIVERWENLGKWSGGGDSERRRKKATDKR